MTPLKGGMIEDFSLSPLLTPLMTPTSGQTHKTTALQLLLTRLTLLQILLLLTTPSSKQGHIPFSILQIRLPFCRLFLGESCLLQSNFNLYPHFHHCFVAKYDYYPFMQCHCRVISCSLQLVPRPLFPVLSYLIVAV